MKQESEAPIKFTPSSILAALFAASNRAKEEAAAASGAFGQTVKNHVELNNLHPQAFGQAASIYRKSLTNEIKAKEHLAQLRHYLDIAESLIANKGHFGNLDDMARNASDSEDEEEDEEADPNLVTAPGGLPHDESLARFEANLSKAANRKKVAKLLDIPKLDPDARDALADIAGDPAPVH